MTQLITGANLIVSGGLNLAILGEIAASLTYESFKRDNPKSLITEEQFEEFITTLCTPLIAAGLLTHELHSTYRITTHASVL